MGAHLRPKNLLCCSFHACAEEAPATVEQPPREGEVLSVGLDVDTARRLVLVGFKADGGVAVVTLGQRDYGREVVFAAEEIELHSGKKR